MPQMTFGAFREVYRGNGIYWAGTYNVEGNGAYRTLGEARNAIDSHVDHIVRLEAKEHAAKVASGGYLVARRNADGIVCVRTPDGDIEYATIREARRDVFKLEDRFNLSLIWE